nr:hypothetical protein [Tanacetum cinerariifolium]
MTMRMKEISIVKVDESGNGDEETTDIAKTYAEKNEEVNDDAKKVELPPTSSNLFVSSCFGDQFLKLSSDTYLIVIVKDTTDPSVITPVQESPSVAPITTLPPPYFSTIVPTPYQTTEPIPTPPIITDALTITIAVPESNALSAIQKHTSYLIQKHSVKLGPKLTKIQTPTDDLKQESKKSPSEIHKIKREQAEKQKMPKQYNDDDDDDNDDEDPSARPNQGKKIKRRRTKESKSSKKPFTTKENSKGKFQSKGSKTDKSVTTKEPIKEPIADVVMDDAVNTTGEDVVRDDDQQEDTSEPKTHQTSNPDWFKQPPRPPTP